MEHTRLNRCFVEAKASIGVAEQRQNRDSSTSSIQTCSDIQSLNLCHSLAGGAHGRLWPPRQWPWRNARANLGYAHLSDKSRLPLLISLSDTKKNKNSRFVHSGYPGVLVLKTWLVDERHILMPYLDPTSLIHVVLLES